MRRLALLLAVIAAPALAQPVPATPPIPAAPAAAAPGAPDPVVARVDGADIRLSEVQEAMAGLPEEYRNAPPAMIFPLMVDQMVAQKAIVAAARAQGLANDPTVQRRMRRAEEVELQQAFIAREVAPLITDEALRARYTAQTATRGGEEEVRARHILVPTEAEARTILAEARRPGVDFADLARRRGTGPGTQSGGDLGFFKRDDMVPEFATAAFALQPGQIAEAPVRSQFGWHVIKVEERRTAPAPSFEDSRETLRQQAVEETVGAVVERIRAAATIERFNIDGSPIAPAPAAPARMPDAVPPPAPARR
ncbi:peptidylprolyl isomerase [Humitalea sp. 24SJ18S-53]|uniref:peptidylprolyl isomerase n=1 Tax=Humitalea sp. 24SJ18S-53 TaxID=3422307 RepID=UPI003D66FF38